MTSGMVFVAVVYILGAFSMFFFSFDEGWRHALGLAFGWPLVVLAIFVAGLFEVIHTWGNR